MTNGRVVARNHAHVIDEITSRGHAARRVSPVGVELDIAQLSGRSRDMNVHS